MFRNFSLRNQFSKQKFNSLKTLFPFSDWLVQPDVTLRHSNDAEVEFTVEKVN